MTCVATLKYSVSWATSTWLSVASEMLVKPSTSENITVMRRGPPLGVRLWPSSMSWFTTSTGTNLRKALSPRADSSSAWSRWWISSTRLSTRGSSSRSKRPMRRAMPARFSTGAVISFDRRSDMNRMMPSDTSTSISDHSTARRRPPRILSSGTQLISSQSVAGIREVCTR